MIKNSNQNPEQIARNKIDEILMNITKVLAIDVKELIISNK